MKNIGKIPFGKFTYATAEQKINSVIDGESPCQQVVIANAYSVVLAQKNSLFASVCSSAEFVFADGMPIIWISRFFGQKIPERIAGPDFMWSYCGICAEKGYRVFLLGGDERSLENLKENLLRKYPKLLIAGAYSPPFGTWSNAECTKMVEIINASKSNVLWVGVSTPKQDIWISEHKAALKVNVAFGVGAAFDFHSGKIKRAPAWIQQAGLEWLYRLSQDPARLWKRYVFGNGVFIRIVIGDLLQKTLSRLTYTKWKKE